MEVTDQEGAGQGLAKEGASFGEALRKLGKPEMPPGYREMIDQSVPPFVPTSSGAGGIIRFKGEGFPRPEEVVFLSYPEGRQVTEAEREEAERFLDEGNGLQVLTYFHPAVGGVNTYELQVLRDVLWRRMSESKEAMLSGPTIEAVRGYTRAAFQLKVAEVEGEVRSDRWRRSKARRENLGVTWQWLNLYAEALGEIEGGEGPNYKWVRRMMDAERRVVAGNLDHNEGEMQERGNESVRALVEEQREELKKWDGCIQAAGMNFTSMRN